MSCAFLRHKWFLPGPTERRHCVGFDSAGCKDPYLTWSRQWIYFFGSKHGHSISSGYVLNDVLDGMRRLVSRKS
jgi:hypothetical protein